MVWDNITSIGTHLVHHPNFKFRSETNCLPIYHILPITLTMTKLELLSKSACESPTWSLHHHMSCGYIFNLELVNTFVCTPNFSQHLVVHSDMKFSHLLNAKFYSKYRIDILFIIQTCLKSQKICCDSRGTTSVLGKRASAAFLDLSISKLQHSLYSIMLWN